MDAFLAELSCLKIPNTPPTHFNSSCKRFVPEWQGWNLNLQIQPENEIQEDKENEIEMNEIKTDTENEINTIKMQQGYANSGTLSHMVCISLKLTIINRETYHLIHNHRALLLLQY